MSANIITLEEWVEFKTELIQEIRTILSESNNTTNKKWLKSSEVRKMLNVSPGTLQTLRVNGTLPFTKIGGTHFYSLNDIEKIMSKKKQ